MRSQVLGRSGIDAIDAAALHPAGEQRPVDPLDVGEGHLGRLPTPGDTVRAEGMVFEVLNVRGRRVGRVRVERTKADEQDGRAEEEALSRSA